MEQTQKTNSGLMALKKLGIIVLSLFSMTLITACPPKPNRATVNRGYFRNPNWNGNPNGGFNQVPGGSGSTYNEQTWGAIFTNTASFGQVLNDFMYGISDLGFVSGSPNSNTGVRFRGQVNVGGQNGQIDLLVWDDQANYSNPYYWTLSVVGVSSNNNNISIIVEDNVGQVRFDGSVQNGMFNGRVSFSNTKTDGASGTLGQFSIAAGSLLY